jgi:hypothetical protein
MTIQVVDAGGVTRTISTIDDLITALGSPGQVDQAHATTVTTPTDIPFSVVDGGFGPASVWGVGGVPVASTDMSAGVVVTDAPASGKHIVVDDMLLSIGAVAMDVTLKEETTGTVLFGPWHCPANSGPLQITTRGKKRLATADKRVVAFGSVAGSLTVHLGYHSEA